MPQYEDFRKFDGGFNSDDDPRDIPNNDFIDGLNLVSGLSTKGSLVKMLGNTKINFILPAGNNTIIGALRDIKRNAVIYFVFNDAGNHSILHYFCLTRTIEAILAPLASISFTTDFLGFTLDHKIHSANIIDEILTWTDNSVSPRKLNIKRAKDFMLQLTPSAANTPYSNLLATGTPEQKIQFIELIKYKPFRQPTISLQFNSARKTNYIIDQMIQVSYRYIYDDNEKSRWSDGSYISLPEGQENINGTFSNSVANNFIRVTLNTGHPTVKSIDVAFRFGNTGAWGRLDAPIRKYDNDNQQLIADYIDYEYDFYNDGVLIIVDVQLDNYDAIPQISKTQELIDGNRLTLGNNVEGYENPDLNVSTSYINTHTDMGIGSLFPAIRDVTTNMFTTCCVTVGVPPPYIQNNPTATLREQVFIIPLDPSLIVVGTTVTFTLRRTDDPTFSGGGTYDNFYSINYSISENDLLNWPINFRQSLFDAIATTAYPVFLNQSGQAVNGINIAYIGTQDSFAFATEFTAITDANVILPTKKIASWKKGAFHALGIVYKDRQGRDGGVTTNQAMNLYVPYLPEIIPQNSLDNQFAYQTKARLTINHIPPVWAYEYEIVYALNNLRKYTQFVLKNKPTGSTVDGNYILDCKYIIDYTTKERINGSLSFQFEDGDRLRFICNTDVYVQTYIEAKVLAYDNTTNLLTVVPYSISQVTAGMTSPTQDGTLVEMFAYKDQTALENRPYFSIGETYNVIDAGLSTRAHEGNVQNQTNSQPAIVDLTRGDTYIFRRYFKNNTIVAMVESQNFSDFYQSANIDISYVYAVIPNGVTKRYEQQLRYGGRYFSLTQTNDLCTFNGSDFINLDTRYGPINKVATVAYVLKVLQTKKNTSIYINRSMIFTADGQSQITQSNEVFANINPSEQDYGCIHPESVFVSERQLFFYDVYNGAFVQDSANGMFAISDYKARTYFRNISNLIKDNPNVYVYAQADYTNAYINISFVDTNIAPIIESQTVVYSTTDNRWKGHASYIPEYFASNALVFISFKDGELYVHNDNQTRCEFYGVSYPAELTFVSNVDPLKVKVFDNLAIYSNKVWSSPTLGDITIPSSENYPTGMSSRLLDNKFIFKEGVCYAAYIRDANTPNFATVQQALLGGRKLRGEVLTQKIQNTDSTEVIIYSVIVKSTPSEYSK